MSFAWSPSERYLARSRLRQFAAAHGYQDFASLHRWSIEDLEGFWRAVERDLGLVWKKPYDRVHDTSRGIPWTTWWLGGRMNFVASALRHDSSRTAIIFEGEEGTTRRLTYGELDAAVLRCERAHHGGRLPAARAGDPDEGNRGRGRGRRAERPPRDRRAAVGAKRPTARPRSHLGLHDGAGR